MSYVDGFVLAVPTAKREAYIAFAQDAAPIFRDHGAIGFVECWGDDVPNGKSTSFPMAVNADADETVVLAWIIWPSKEARDSGMAKVNADPRSAHHKPENIPFDGKRMIFGGFTPIVELD